MSRAATWFPLGPFGGDARSLADDPADSNHIFLGTATGWIYDSHDGGQTWKRVSQIAGRNDLVVDHILVDHTNPKRLIAGTWIVDHPSDGGVYISEDYGKTWYSQAQLRGQAVLSLTRSDSRPQELVAGTLKGVFLSDDNGVHWKEISPEGSTEIHEVQSVAVDPADPNVIYAGTWHLPWKTTDGGVTWHNIKQGVIDDSDVFSIIVDPKSPQTVYASACSGIYKSENGGDLFHKVEGIPSTARRTRSLAQDPEHLRTVFAGTTEGLYRTVDAGSQWERLTPASVIVNDVQIDPKNPNHVLLATDRGGVYRSEDGGSTFQPSNDGFSARQVTSYTADPRNANTLYVGVVNDKTTGGVFQSTDGGVHWQQQSDGLGGRDVFSLLSLDDGTLLAGTEHGIFRLNEGANWVDSSLIEAAPAAQTAKVVPTHVSHMVPASTPRVSAKHAAPARQVHTPQRRSAAARRSVSARRAHTTRTGPAHVGTSHIRPRSHVLRANYMQAVRTPVGRSTAPLRKPEAVVPKEARANRIDTVVYTLTRSGDTLFAGTASGLLRSVDQGIHWAPVGALPVKDVHFMTVQPKIEGSGSAGTMMVGDLTSIAFTSDGGTSWKPLVLPAGLTEVGAVGVDGSGALWVGGREGVWLSKNQGATWDSLRTLFLRQVDSIYYDAHEKRVLVTSSSSPMAFSVALPDYKVTYADTGWKLRFVRPVGDHLVGATLFDGVVVQPEMVDSAPVTTAKVGDPQ